MKGYIKISELEQLIEKAKKEKQTDSSLSDWLEVEFYIDSKESEITLTTVWVNSSYQDAIGKKIK